MNRSTIKTWHKISRKIWEKELLLMEKQLLLDINKNYRTSLDESEIDFIDRVRQLFPDLANETKSA